MRELHVGQKIMVYELIARLVSGKTTAAQISSSYFAHWLRLLNIQKRKLYCALIDFSKAFDTIPRSKLWICLEKLGIHGKMLKTLQAMYHRVQALVKTPEGPTDRFASDMGPKQGCPLSPLLFGLYIDGLELLLQHSLDKIHAPEINGVRIPLLMYADDSKLLSWEPSGLQTALDLLVKYADEHGLFINTSKTKIMVFNHKTSDLKANWSVYGEPVEVVKEFKDLGLTINNTVKWPSACVPDLLASGKRALHALKTRCRQYNILSPPQIIQLFDALVKPVLLYACEIWGPDLCLEDVFPKSSHALAIERVHLNILKWTLGVRKCTPSHHVRGEFGRMSLSFNICVSVLKYYERLTEMHYGRLLKIAFLQSLKLANKGHKTWVSEVHKLVSILQIKGDHETSIQENWECQLRSKFQERWIADLSDSVKGPLYLQIKNAQLNMSEHLTQVVSRSKCRNLSKFRTGAHSLAIELGRHKQLPREDRLCRTCRVVEDEAHFLFDCPCYFLVRQNHCPLFTAERQIVADFLNQDCNLVACFLNECEKLRVIEYDASTNSWSTWQTLRRQSSAACMLL